MPVRKFRPTSPGRRGATGFSFTEITKHTPEKSLLAPKKQRAGRNNRGVITVRHRGGGAKRKIRIVDFRRDKPGVPGRIAGVEYDPGRSARIALVHYADGEKRYIVAPTGVAVGQQIVSGPSVPITMGNTLPLAALPPGTTVHNVELQPGRGAQLARAAGAGVQLMAKDNGRALLRLPSGEMRYVSELCMATVGTVGNAEHALLKLGKAGRTRHRGRRPQVRGSAMNPVDHPHGGGEGKASIGMPGPKTPWGKPALGFRTRNNKRTDRSIQRRRGSGRR
ncbi:MAG: 50S ribosomal protein L2 [Dehalococcoidia bacterium]|nr:50S ribosomal protein L2 [Dehalococcoidia bacterium]